MNNGITPNRKTTVTFDVAETVCVSPFQGWRRRGGEVGQGRANGLTTDPDCNGVRLWPSGCWTLDPIQSEISNLQEYAISLQHIVAPDNATLLEKLALIPSINIEHQYRTDTDLAGMAYSGNINAVGAPFLVRKISAGGTWDEQLDSGVPSVLGGPDGSRVPDVPVDRVIESVASYPPNQGFFLNWSNPGTTISYPGVYFVFYFGQFAVSFSGSGRATLSEHLLNPGGSGTGWHQRASWKYARTGQVSATAHSMGIWPHKGPSGQKYIAFTNGQVDFAQVTSSFATTAAAVTTAPGDFIYTCHPLPGFPEDTLPDITISAPLRADVRRNWRMPVQFSTLGWPTSGTLRDDPGAVTPDSTSLEASASPLVISVDSVALPGTGIAATLVNAEDGAPYDNTLHTHPSVRFNFTSDGFSTPQLWGYGVHRAALAGVAAPGQFGGGTLTSVSVTGYSGDPSQVSAHVHIEDLKGELPRLRNRGQMRARIDVTHREAGQSIITPIFQGYAVRPMGTRRARPRRTYPSAEWYGWDVPLQGMWTRLAEPTSGPLLSMLFYSDPAVPPNQRRGLSAVPWKVTDAIRYLIACAGFSPAEINIPDLPIRFWPGLGDAHDAFAIQPNAQYSEMIQKFARNYLGAYLIYSEADSYWTLLGGTPLDAPPLYHFVTGTPAQTGGSRQAVPTLPGAYGPLTTYCTEFREESVPAEYNMIHVLCPVPAKTGGTKIIEQWRVNHKSYRVPGSSVVPDPLSPDYIGRLRPCKVVDPSLLVQVPPGTGASSDAATQAAVDYTCNRLYDFCCHGQKLDHFTAPLVFIQDPQTGAWRALRFLDPITINGQAGWQVKACVPNYTTDSVQLAQYECIQPVAGQYVPPGIERLTFHRQGFAKVGAANAGSTTQSGRFGSLGIAPHAESKYDALPRETAYQAPIQDPATGEPYPMAGY